MYDAEIVDRVNRIDRFARCGQPFKGKFPIPVRRFVTWPEAEENSISQTWENAELEFSNRLSEFLHCNAGKEYQLWNFVVVKAKNDVIGPLERNV
ncbi:MAG TPA: hypothetical protein VN089_25840 [Duganella sp.]|nr:hypothetical protein [Duganella sp.]